MDVCSAASHLADAEARRIRPITDVEGPDSDLATIEARSLKLPVIEIYKNDMGRLAARGSGHHGHDNADRMALMCAFIENRVAPLVDTTVADVTGYYRIELHDSFSYLPNRTRYRDSNAMVFSRPGMYMGRVAAIPDPYHISNFGGLLDAVRAGRSTSVPWASKKDAMLFAGTTTGHRDPVRNARIQACLWALKRPDRAVFKITNVAQMTMDDITRAIPEHVRSSIHSIFHPPIPVPVHFDFKYLVNVVGNTACWSRVPMILSSNSLLLNVEHEDIMWYSPLIVDGTHYIGSGGETFVESDSSGPSKSPLDRAYQWCRDNDRECQEIVKNANKLSDTLFAPTMCEAYMAHFLETCAYNARA